MGNPRHYVLRSKLDLHTSSLDPYRPKLHACLDLNMQAHGRCLQDQGIPFGNPNHTRDLLTDAQQCIIDRKLNMRFTELLREKLSPSVFLLESTILTKKVQICGNFSTPQTQKFTIRTLRSFVIINLLVGICVKEEQLLKKA